MWSLATKGHENLKRFTHKTLRSDRVVSSLGIDPVSLLSFNRLHDNYKFKQLILEFTRNWRNYTLNRYSQKSKRLQVSKRLWYLSLEFVSIKIHANEFTQTAQLRGDFSIYAISVKFPAINAKPLSLS